MRGQRAGRESPWCPGRASHLGCSPLQNGDELRSPAGPRRCPGSEAARPSVGGAESPASRRASQQGRPRRFPTASHARPWSFRSQFPSAERAATALLATYCSLCGSTVTGPTGSLPQTLQAHKMGLQGLGRECQPRPPSAWPCPGHSRHHPVSPPDRAPHRPPRPATRVAGGSCREESPGKP